MALNKRAYTDGTTVITAENLNEIQDAVIALEEAGGGASGTDGKSAYQYAVEGGYTGTEAEFAAKLAQETYSKNQIDAIMGSYINDINALVGGDG